MIVPSEKIRRILEGYQVECPLWVVPSGIRLSEFGGSGEEGTARRTEWREKIRKRYLLTPDSTVLLYVGRQAFKMAVGRRL